MSDDQNLFVNSNSTGDLKDYMRQKQLGWMEEYGKKRFGFWTLGLETGVGSDAVGSFGGYQFKRRGSSYCRKTTPRNLQSARIPRGQ